MTLILRAKVPILSGIDRHTGIKSDICVNNLLGVANSQLVKKYTLLDSRFPALYFVIKQWSQKRNIHGASLGLLSSYAYCLMLIYFLQNATIPVLPCLQASSLLENEEKIFIDGFDCTYCSNIVPFIGFGGANKNSTGQLLVEFFQFYSEFDFQNLISIRNPIISDENWPPLLQRKTPEDTSIELDEITDLVSIIRQQRHMFIEDPFEITHNLAKGVQSVTSAKIKIEFQRAFQLLRDGGTLDNIFGIKRSTIVNKFRNMHYVAQKNKNN